MNGKPCVSDAVPAREWRFYVTDMIGFCERVQSFTHGFDQSGCVADAMRFDATVRNIELLGEAAIHVPESVRSSATAIPWRLVIATRNKLIHGYLGIDDDTLWSIIKTDIPNLLDGLRELKAGLS